jgi:hypothetical protein
MTNKKEFIKVNIEDLVYAKEFFDNTSDYSLWLYAVTEYYQGNEVVIKKKIVKKYFDNYKKTMNIVIEAKEFGKKGALKRYENQQVKEDTLEATLHPPLEDTLQVNNKVLNINNKEHIDFQALLEVINFSFSRKFEMINEVTQKKFNKLLKDGYKKQNILFAIKNCANDTFHKENNYKYCTPDYFARPKTIDMYGNDLPIGIVEEKTANNTFAWDR